MKAYVESTPDPLDPSSKLVYVNGEFLQWRSGVVAAPAGQRATRALAGGAVRSSSMRATRRRLVGRTGAHPRGLRRCCRHRGVRRCVADRESAIEGLRTRMPARAKRSRPTKGRSSRSLPAPPPCGEDMPGDAKEAYGRGFAAWAAGDLPGAKAAFTDAASKAPKAGSPALLARLRAREAGGHPGRARRLPRGVHRELEVRGGHGRLRAAARADGAGARTPSSSWPTSGRRIPTRCA